MSPPTDQLILYLTSPQGALTVQHGKVPTPSKNELLVKVHSAGLNPVDWKIAKYGIFLTDKDYPAILGTDGAGEVVGYGDDVKGWAQGQKV
jgi:NADPH:quinone reductase-like Zn-dependent oxidoreductase